LILLGLLPLSLSAVLLAAHHFRVSETGLVLFWLLAPSALLLRRKWATRAVQFLLLIGALIWIDTARSIIQVRQLTGQSWTNVAIILGSVSLLAIASALILNTSKLRNFFLVESISWKSGGAAFLITIILLAVVQTKVRLPILLLERFIPGSGWLEIFGLAIYAGWLAEKLSDINQTAMWRRRIWLAFSIVFFAQLILGLAGIEKFLMTGKLHMPMPAMIIAGPLYRGDGIFMPLLFISTVLLVGPGWCSYLCYIGSWDLTAADCKRKPKPLPAAGRAIRLAILAIVPATAISFRLLGVSLLAATIAALSFGIIGVIVMLILSKKLGTMVHCVAYCPIGILANWLGKISPFRIRLNDSCNECGACTFACRYDALNIDDIQSRQPGLTCTLCGDCLSRCRETAIEYRFLGLSPMRARTLFVVMIASLHAIFMGTARI